MVAVATGSFSDIQRPTSTSVTVSSHGVTMVASFMVTLQLRFVPLKTSAFYFLYNSVKNEPILIIFDVQNAEEIRH